MEIVTWVASTSVLAGGFVILGLWKILSRQDVTVSARQGMNPEGLRYGSGAPGFGNAKTRTRSSKLAIVATRRRRQESIADRLALEHTEHQVREQLETLSSPPRG